MKKIYTTPVIDLFEVKRKHVIATSGVGTGDTLGEGYDAGDRNYMPGIFGGLNSEE